ncbi:Glutamate-ammonia-ligase adenylyltransferase [hydrothermal vent metagenome]|uniref:Glutamate-ammonia-ligase adenylyltransferase n=1 Tax=hydrothermal vent metagenome TaxID=652676 RepID=A0A3B0ZBP8_9ZZZZ
MTEQLSQITSTTNTQEKGLPEPLIADVREYWLAYEQAATDEAVIPVSHAELKNVLYKVWLQSDFVARLCINAPARLHELCSSGDLLLAYLPGEAQQRIKAELTGTTNISDLKQRLRQWRQREMLRIAWRDLAGWADLKETMFALSELASACMDIALCYLTPWLQKEYGTPYGEQSKKPQHLVVLGMGKLGAYELNFSSDIDLIFVFPEEGETQGAMHSISNHEYFIKLGRQLIDVIGTRTVDGFVFRVDMRLRPFGNSGSLVMNFDAIALYYQTQGRDWERYALIKARPVAGDIAQGEMLLESLSPFVFRRYLDFGALEALREMKGLIAQQVRKKSLVRNIKLGAGGIREIEFVGQVFQLIRGGCEPRLKARGIVDVLQTLRVLNYLPAFVVHELIIAYDFLRRTENRLQAYADRQTHDLPQDEREQLKLAYAMGFTGWSEFYTCLQKTMQTVHHHFEQVFTAPQTEHANDDENKQNLATLWAIGAEFDQAHEVLQHNGFQQPEEVVRCLTTMRASSSYRHLSSRGRVRLDHLIPLTLGAAAQATQPTVAFLRVMMVLEAIGRRSAYYALLLEHPMALSQLVQLCAASPWLTTYVAQHPLLLDELLDPRFLYAPPDRAALAHEMSQLMQRVKENDLESQMDVLRSFTQSNILKVAAADVSDALPLMKVSDHLTAIAEVVLNKVMECAWQHLLQRYGMPTCSDAGVRREARFAIIAYGKMGGYELGYGSDLDLVFLHDGDEVDGVTEGDRSVSHSVFFARLAQRIIHMLRTQTPTGVMYDVDVRLRPSGASGLLVTSMSSFIRYQNKQAWTWEHQALVRARFVAGAPILRQAFERIRQQVLARERDPVKLQTEVREMRERMRQELASKRSEVFDIKQDRGGIADIEFIVQYLTLRWGHQYPELLQWEDNIRLLASCKAIAVLQPEQADVLSNAYRSYRSEVHKRKLQNEPAEVSSHYYVEERKAVSQIWHDMMESE